MGVWYPERVSGTFQLTDDVKLIETPGHTPGSMSVIVDTSLGTVAIIGDLAIRRQDYIEKRTPIYVRDRKAIMESHEKITKLNPVAVIPGHDLPIWDLGRFPVPMKNFELTGNLEVVLKVVKGDCERVSHAERSTKEGLERRGKTKTKE